MKRIILILAIFAILALLTACSAGPAAPAPVATSQVDVAQLGPNVDVATVKALQGRDDVLILDVREQSEYDAGHIPDVKLIPLNDVPNRLK